VVNRLDNQSEPDASASNGGKVLKGIPVSAGIGIGQIIVLDRLIAEVFPQRIISELEITGEIDRFEAAVNQAANQLMEIRKDLNGDHPLSEHRYILDTHLMLLEDRIFFQGAKDSIANERLNAEWALSEIIDRITAAFDTIEDEYLKERAMDVRFVGKRVLRILMGYSQDGAFLKLPPNAIIVGHDLSPAETAQLSREHVLAFVTEVGGKTSHTAIMARSLKIPAVTGVEKLLKEANSGDTIIVDGAAGLVILNPDPDQMFRYRGRREIFHKYEQSLMAFGRLPAVTTDGALSTKIFANVEFADEIDIALAHGAEGIGLFRTEYLFMGRADLPTEDEQYAVYRNVVEAISPKPVTIRTLDAGGDKISRNLNLSKESNPAMGLRAIRLCLNRMDIFETQLRAIYRAAAHGKVRLLVPMISCLSELEATKETLDKVKNDLKVSGVQYNPDLEIGLLVEVPSAVAIADLLAREVDFFSIGTNDLIQYALAIDRVNENVNYLYDTLHPAILRLIKQVTEMGTARGIKVGMCGEMAGDPVNIPILLSLGLGELSMNALSIPMVKKLIRSISVDECRELAREAFEMSNAQEIHRSLEAWIRNRFPEDYFVDGIN
jgi:phosphotransferase system enzyme I (PtsI)